MAEPIFNHSEIYHYLYNGNTMQAIKSFTEKTKPEEFTPFLRSSYLSSLNFGIYNYVLLKENISLHECCMENERKILTTTNESFIDTGINIIYSYGNDTNYIAEKYSNQHIKAAISYIHNHLSELLSLDMVSNAICINSSYFSELFKKEVGENFCDYVNMQRIKTAKRLLNHTTLSIQEISERCGYKSIGYFSTCFRKITQKSPSAYRRA